MQEKTRNTCYDKESDHLCKDIWKLATNFHDILSNRSDIFIFLKYNKKNNRSREINNLSKWLLNLRHSIGHSDINYISYPDMHQHMNNLNTSSDNNSAVCYLSHTQNTES